MTDIPSVKADELLISTSATGMIVRQGTRYARVEAQAGKTFIADANGYITGDGPTATDIADAQENAVIAADAAARAEAVADILEAITASAVLGFNFGPWEGDGVTTTFTLPGTVTGTAQVYLFLDGVAQLNTKFSVAGDQLTFVTAPKDGEIAFGKVLINSSVATAAADAILLQSGETVQEHVDAESSLVVYAATFGFQGIGTAADTEKLHDARDWLAANGGGRLLIGAGTWLVAKTGGVNWADEAAIFLGTGHDGIVIEGAGMGVTTLKMADGERGDIIKIGLRAAAATGANPQRCGVKNLSLDGNKANRTIAEASTDHFSGITVYGQAHYTHIENVRSFNSPYYGVGFEPPEVEAHWSGVRVINCVFEDCEADGIDMKDTAGLNHGNIFSGLLVKNIGTGVNVGTLQAGIDTRGGVDVINCRVIFTDGFTGPRVGIRAQNPATGVSSTYPVRIRDCDVIGAGKHTGTVGLRLIGPNVDADGARVTGFSQGALITAPGSKLFRIRSSANNEGFRFQDDSGAGWEADGCELIACAADGNDTFGYVFNSVDDITLTACDATNNNTGYDIRTGSTGIMIVGGQATGNSTQMIDNGVGTTIMTTANATVRLGRNINQHLEISGDATANYLRSVSLAETPKPLRIQADANSGNMSWDVQTGKYVAARVHDGTDYQDVAQFQGDRIALLQPLSSGGVFFNQWTYANRAAFLGATVPDWVQTWTIMQAGRPVQYRRDASATNPAITSANGVKGMPWSDYTPLHWGALADGSDDGAAINLALAAYKAEVEASHQVAGRVAFDGLGLDYSATISLNATGITGWGWCIRNIKITSTSAGKCVLDMIGSRGGSVSHVSIWGDAASTPSVGLQNARSGTGEEAFSNGILFENVHIDGYFSTAAIYCYGQETTHHDHCRYWNRLRTGRAAVFMGHDTIPMTSDYLAPITGHTSYIDNLYSQCEFRYLPVGSNIALITGITKANPAVVTCAAGHSFANGMEVCLSQVAGMTQANNQIATVANATATTFELTGVNSTAWATYTSGGLAARTQTVPTVVLGRGSQHKFKACYAVNYGTYPIQLEFPDAARMDDIQLDFLYEGAFKSAIAFNQGSSSVAIRGLNASTYNLHARDGFMEALGSGVVTLAGGDVTVRSHAYTEAPVFKNPALFAAYGVLFAIPRAADLTASALVGFASTVYAVGDTTQSIHGAKLNNPVLQGDGTDRWSVNPSNGAFIPASNLGANIGALALRVAQLSVNTVDLGTTSTNGVTIAPCTGSPEGVVTANPGSIRIRSDGASGSLLYFKDSGTGNTGWVAKW